MCCFSFLSPYSETNTNTPLLKNEIENNSVETLLKKLELMLRAKRAQAEQYRIDGMENRLRMNHCVTQGDKTGAKHYCIEARKSDHYYEQELKQSANIQEAYRKMKQAIVNLEIAKSLSASNVTLEQLQKEMPTEKLDEIMDAFRDNVFEVDHQSKTLSEDFNSNQEDVEAEVEQLFLKQLELPSVPTTNILKGGNKIILKTE